MLTCSGAFAVSANLSYISDFITIIIIIIKSIFAARINVMVAMRVLFLLSTTQSTRPAPQPPIHHHHSIAIIFVIIIIISWHARYFTEHSRLHDLAALPC